MAKRPTVDNSLFKKTEGAPPAEPQQEAPRQRNPSTYPIGVYLTEEEKQQIEVIAQELGWKRHKVLQEAVRYFMAHYKAGKIKTQTRTVETTEIIR